MGRIVVGYVRVSTSKAEQTTSVEGQLHDLKTRWSCDRVIAERKGAYARGTRPGWDELRALVAERKVSLVVVADQSRMARDLSDQEFLEECAVVGTKVVNVHGEEIENQSVGGLMTTGMMSVVNRVQSRMIGVRVREGVRRRREAGYYGRGKVPFGYQFQAGSIVQHPQNWPLARWLVERLIAERCNLVAVLRQLPDDFPIRYSRQGLLLWLCNPILRGGVGLGLDKRRRTYERVVWGQAPALISLEEWRTIARQMEVRARGRGGVRTNNEHTFSGLIRCELCKKRLWWAGGRHRRPRYNCGQIGCANHHRGVLESVVATAVKAEFTQIAKTMAAKAAEYASTTPPPTAEQLDAEEQLAILESLDDRGNAPDGVRKAIGELRNRLLTWKAIPHSGLPIQAYQRLFAQAETWDLATPEELRAVVVEFVNYVEFRGPDMPLVVKLRRGSSELGR